MAAAAEPDLRRPVGQDQPDGGCGASGRVQLMPELTQFFMSQKLCQKWNNFFVFFCQSFSLKSPFMGNLYN